MLTEYSVGFQNDLRTYTYGMQYSGNTDGRQQTGIENEANIVVPGFKVPVARRQVSYIRQPLTVPETWPMHNQAENLNETILLRQNENGQLHPLHRTNIDPEIQVSMPVYEAGNQEAVVMRSRPSAAVRAEFEEAGEAEILSQRSVASSARVRQRNAEVTRRNVNVSEEVFGARSGNFEERPSTVDRFCSTYTEKS